MHIPFDQETYDNISQRAIASFCRGIRASEPGADETPAQRDLRGFFTALYAAMYQDAGRFGLPTGADDGLLGETEGSDRKQEVTRKLKKPREVLGVAVEMLQEMGSTGQLAGDDLLFHKAAFQALSASKARARKAVLAGMADAGLAIVEEEGGTALRNSRFPRMMPALKEMAERCAASPEPGLATFHFARCDFRALRQEHQPGAPALLGFFAPEARERALRLHAFLLSTGHQPTCRICGMHAWDIQYQGPRKIKGSPLMQIEYSERHRDPLQVRVKCASADRLLPTFAEQPQAVRDDFRRRVHRCGGASCGWCKSRKNLGPSVLEHKGEKLTICWYTCPDVGALNDDALETLQGYVHWHQILA